VALPPAAVDTGLVPRHHHRTATEQSDRVETLPQESCEPKSRSLLVYVFCKRIRKHSQVVWHKLGFVCWDSSTSFSGILSFLLLLPLLFFSLCSSFHVYFFAPLGLFLFCPLFYLYCILTASLSFTGCCSAMSDLSFLFVKSELWDLSA
jgi:hypothetical protein